MVRDPRELYELEADAPRLEGAVLLHHLDGHMDAGGAGRLLAEHLRERSDHRVVARFDVDRLIDYRARRPSMIYATDHWEGYEDPELAVRLLHDADGTPFLLMTGPEPDHEWRLFTAALIDLAERLGVRTAVGAHGIPMAVPHTRPLGVIGHGSRPELLTGFQSSPNRIQVPGNISALIELRFGEAGYDALGFAVQVPHYLSQTAFPTAAIAALDAVTRGTGLRLPADSLREAARRADVEIALQINGSEEIAEAVRALERQYDAFTDTAGRESLLADMPDVLPTADELGERFEQFLTEQAERGRGEEV
jgi:predicted ATP-grasp superfamily ATP-dependent carboligase